MFTEAVVPRYAQLMNRPFSDAIVVGGGVSGLTTAACLIDAGFSVRIWAADEMVDTASYAAGAIYSPFLTDDDRAPEWAGQTFGQLAELAEDPETGVAMVFGHEVSRTAMTPPSWARLVPGFRQCGADDLPPGFASGWCYTVPVVDMPIYLSYLHRRVEERGGVVERRRVSSLDEAAATGAVVVNCTGMGARDLVPDPKLRPIRGELVVVPNPGIDAFVAEHFASDRELTYLLPQRDVVVLGGTADESRTDREPDKEVAEGILARCIDIEPKLAGLPILEHRVGIRPVRDRVRIEWDSDNGHLGTVLHNYGHGGAGVSLSWGCAREVIRLLADEKA
jgi:D-amino-acid oxidase